MKDEAHLLIFSLSLEEMPRAGPSFVSEQIDDGRIPAYWKGERLSRELREKREEMTFIF